MDKTGQASDVIIVYLIRADLITAKRVCDQINSHLGFKPNGKYHIIFVPKLLVPVELLFEEEGLIGKVVLHVFEWELIQLDSKVLSFECPEIYKQLFIENDQSLLTSIAKSLWTVQHVFGKIPLALYHGRYSNIISTMIDCWMDETGEPDKPDSDIGCMIVVDRDIDYSSILMTPGTYTSLVSDVINISSNVVEIKPPNPEKKELAVTMQLNSEDEIYNQIKNKHFSDVFIFLKNKASELNMEIGKKNTMNIKEMKEFVKNDLSKAANFGKALSNHINICERVTNDIGQKFESLQICQENIIEGVSRKDVITYIEDIMATGSDMYLVLRLICLLSLTQDGLSHEESNNLKTQFFHAYGYEHLSLFYNLEKAGLFSWEQLTVPASLTETSVKLASKMVQVVSLPKRSSFQISAQKLKLFPDTTKDYSLKDPQDPGYVFGGAYIPLIAQVVNYLIKREISVTELTKSLPGNQSGKMESKWVGKNTEAFVDINPRNVLVYIVGGITYAEIAALQLVEKRTGCRILCCGSSVINGNVLMQSAM